MKAIILAAGAGTRLGPEYAGQPKCLIDFEGNSLLEIQLNTLHANGIDDVTVVRGYKAEKISIPGLKYYDNPDFKNKNILHSLFCAQKEMTEELLILYADILYEEDVIRRIMESSHDIAVGVLTNWKEAIKQRDSVALEKLEMIYFDSENRIQEISKRQTEDHQTQGQFIGIIKCSKRGVGILQRNYDRTMENFLGKPFGQAENFKNATLADLFQEMTYLGVQLHCVIIEHGWMEIDTPEDYKRALEDTHFIRRLIRTRTDWDHRSKFYNRLDWVNRDKLLSTMVDEAENLEGKKILDLGTGTGKVLMAFKEKWPDADYYGVDISRGMLDKIDTEFEFKLSICEIEDLKTFHDEEFDLVSARMVFHHSRNLSKAMHEVHRVLKKGGKFILCEGVPPDRNCLPFYESMFWYKEDRIVFMLDDLINLFIKKEFHEITSKTVMYRDMSLNNWLENSGLPFRNIDIIKKKHFDCEPAVREAYNMKFKENDILMDWRFAVVSGIK